MPHYSGAHISSNNGKYHRHVVPSQSYLAGTSQPSSSYSQNYISAPPSTQLPRLDGVQHRTDTFAGRFSQHKCTSIATAICLHQFIELQIRMNGVVLYYLPQALTHLGPWLQNRGAITTGVVEGSLLTASIQMFRVQHSPPSEVPYQIAEVMLLYLRVTLQTRPEKAAWSQRCNPLTSTNMLL